MIFVSENYWSWKKNNKEGGLHMESIFDFWRNFCQNGWDKALKIGTVPPKLERMVSLQILSYRREPLVQSSRTPVWETLHR